MPRLNRWISADCDEGALVSKRNELDMDGYIPWELRYIEVHDPHQDPIKARRIVRIIAHSKPLRARRRPFIL